MLKHVQISPLRNRSDCVSLRSNTSCASSMCGSPEPQHPVRSTPSRASSYSSLSEQLPQTTIKVFTNCLKIDIEYKTLGIQWDTTSKEVITQLLRRLKMRHRDPRLFYLSMEVTVRSAGVKTILVLDDDTRPAILQACHPKGDSRFCLQLKPGGLIRIHTSALQPSSQYKSLVISEETTSDELLQLLLSCYNCPEPVEQYSIYEVCPGQEYQRKLHPDDIPLRAQAERVKRGENCHFLVRRNPSYAHHRRQLLTALNNVYNANELTSNTAAKKTITTITKTNINSSSANADRGDDDSHDNDDDNDNGSLLNMSIESISEELQSLLTNSDEDEDCSSAASVVTAASLCSATSSSSSGSSNSSTSVSTVSPYSRQNYLRRQHSIHAGNLRTFNCSGSFSSSPCSIAKATSTTTAVNTSIVRSYNPVYNIREIRTASHSFSSLGSDKKLLDIQLNAHFDATTNSLLKSHTKPINNTITLNSSRSSSNSSSFIPKTTTTIRLRTQSICLGSRTPMRMMLRDAHGASSNTANIPHINDINGNNNTSANNNKKVTSEAVNNNPAKGLGHFVYL